MGLSVPDMLKEAIEGTLPWEDVLAYLAFLCFMGCISGMAIMSMNAPFIVHSYSYTFSGIILLFIGYKEYKSLTRLRKWANITKANTSLFN